MSAGDHLIYDPALGFGAPRATHTTYHQLCGGFIIDLDSIIKWGSRLVEEECDPNDPTDIDYAKHAVQDEIEKYCKPPQLLRFDGHFDWEPYGLILVTQSRYFKEPIDTENLPMKFEKGEKEKVAEELLVKNGIYNCEFRTVYR